MKGVREQCIECGMNDYVTKPIKVHSFANTVKKWMGGNGQE